MNKKKTELLGINFSTASQRLRKNLLFALVVDADKNICFHCHKVIDSVDEFSIEHKEPWMSSKNPVQAFFSIENIAYSHLYCNIAAAEKPHKKFFTDESRKEKQFARWATTRQLANQNEAVCQRAILTNNAGHSSFAWRKKKTKNEHNKKKKDFQWLK